MSAVATTSTTPDEDRNLWSTPPALYAYIEGHYGPFTVDAAANEHNHLCAVWFGPGSPFDEDALACTWGPSDDRPVPVFCNPPYARGMVGAFVRKAVEEARAGRARTTLLIPAWTDSQWWAECVWDAERGRFRPGVEVEFLRGRVRFLRPDGTRGDSPTFCSILVTIGGIG